MKFVKLPLNILIDVKNIVSIYYFEFAKDYIYKGEKHDFWEFVYVDRGEIEVMAGATGYRINQGQVIFHKPNEFHNLWANGKIAPNVVVISFDCKSSEMEFFNNKIINLDDPQKELLKNILKEGKNTYYMASSERNNDTISIKENIEFGSEQLIKSYLEQFLIFLIRQKNENGVIPKQSLSIKKRSDNDIIYRIDEYMKDNIYGCICLKDIADYIYLSESYIKILFKQHKNMSIMKYYKNLKIEEGKRLIRESKCNFTQIADELCYNSVHHFSKQFKAITGMAPSEYAKSMMVSNYNDKK